MCFGAAGIRAGGRPGKSRTASPAAGRPGLSVGRSCSSLLHRGRLLLSVRRRWRRWWCCWGFPRWRIGASVAGCVVEGRWGGFGIGRGYRLLDGSASLGATREGSVVLLLLPRVGCLQRERAAEPASAIEGMSSCVYIDILAWILSSICQDKAR